MCQQISATTYTCNISSGGVQKIYIANFENVTGTTANSIGTLTAVNMASGTKFQEFSFARNSGSLEEDATINIDLGVTMYTQKVTFTVPRREAAKRKNFEVLANGQPKLAVIVKDMNNLYWFVGLTNSAYLTSHKSGTGLKMTDGNNYHFEITGEEQLQAPEVDSSVISTII